MFTTLGLKEAPKRISKRAKPKPRLDQFADKHDLKVRTMTKDAMDIRGPFAKRGIELSPEVYITDLCSHLDLNDDRYPELYPDAEEIKRHDENNLLIVRLHTKLMHELLGFDPFVYAFDHEEAAWLKRIGKAGLKPILFYKAGGPDLEFSEDAVNVIFSLAGR